MSTEIYLKSYTALNSAVGHCPVTNYTQISKSIVR